VDKIGRAACDRERLERSSSAKQSAGRVLD